MLLKLAWRNIFRNRRRSFLTISMMVFGFVLFSFFMALSSGAYNAIIEEFINSDTGEFQIHTEDYLVNPKIYKTIKNYENVIEKIEKETKGQATGRIEGAALAFFENKTFGVTIRGVFFNKELKMTTLEKRLKSGVIPQKEYQVLVGRKIAKNLKLKLNDEFVLISSGADGSIANETFMVSGIVDTGSSSFDDTMIYMNHNDAQEFFSMWGSTHEIMIRTNLSQSKLKKEIPALLTLSDWTEVEADFYKAMLADRKGDQIGRFIIIILVALGVLNTILMSILERIREFGVLKAIGTKPSFIFKLIVAESFMLSLIGIGVGVIFAIVVNWYFSINGFVFDPPIEYGGFTFAEMNTSLDIINFILPGGVVLCTSLLVSLYPAYKASKIYPMEALRS